jgi:hypothetical protein
MVKNRGTSKKRFVRQKNPVRRSLSLKNRRPPRPVDRTINSPAFLRAPPTNPSPPPIASRIPFARRQQHPIRPEFPAAAASILLRSVPSLGTPKCGPPSAQAKMETRCERISSRRGTGRAPAPCTVLLHLPRCCYRCSLRAPASPPLHDRSA